jgi:hypothetical protein
VMDEFSRWCTKPWYMLTSLSLRSLHLRPLPLIPIITPAVHLPGSLCNMWNLKRLISNNGCCSVPCYNVPHVHVVTL